MQNTLIFDQEDNKHGSCRCLLNGVDIDGCDMNYTQRYTQAHIVLASVWRTLKTKDVRVIIDGNAAVGQYPIESIVGMANVQVNDNFEDNYGMTRVYSLPSSF